MRVLAVLAACWMLCARTASADTVDTGIRQLEPRSSYKVRLAAALSLSKTKEARAVIALAGTLRNDVDPTIRRVCVLALEKMLDARTAEDAKALGLGALEKAAGSDIDPKVRETATRALKSLAGLRRTKKRSDAPAVFVNIDATTDPTKKLPSDGGARLTQIVKRSVERTGYATSWPGGLPTAAELTSNRSRAFIVASTVKKIQISKVGAQTQIACTIVLRIAPWTGKDGGERWEANKAASASGSAKATTGNRPTDIQGGVRDCVEAVAEDLTSRQVVPFLKRLATAGS
ncbi:MAG: HEAT repeat domain-containing protein [Deltaproteobacteria bacterium]|nr:HEAT repeat domain-containing protein [Deltaproteobacteria bacterium]MDQ3301162.1 HEAT repeat domain-containing protein [Myxococcota bacterium]